MEDEGGDPLDTVKSVGAGLSCSGPWQARPQPEEVPAAPGASRERTEAPPATEASSLLSVLSM